LLVSSNTLSTFTIQPNRSKCIWSYCLRSKTFSGLKNR
ncbi:impB/mucB/samB family protein, partial [Vibrio parahaemolyticus V-223/04]